LEVGITYNRMLCNDFTGRARCRLNMPEVALELKRVWHPVLPALPLVVIVACNVSLCLQCVKMSAMCQKVCNVSKLQCVKIACNVSKCQMKLMT